MLLMAAAAKVIASPVALLAFAKVSTLLLNLINILLIRHWFGTWTTETLANLVAGTVGCTLMFYETINGMDPPLLLTLVLAMLILFPSVSRLGRFGYIFARSARFFSPAGKLHGCSSPMYWPSEIAGVPFFRYGAGLCCSSLPTLRAGSTLATFCRTP
jgi:hypothetical protein